VPRKQSRLTLWERTFSIHRSDTSGAPICIAKSKCSTIREDTTMKKRALIITSLCGLLFSCSSLQTGLVSNSARSSNIQLPYYLPKGLITIDVSYKPKTCKVKKITESSGPSGPVKVTETKEEVVADGKELIPVLTTSLTYVADKSSPRLYAQYSNNIFSKDTIDIKTDEEGLLSSAEGLSEDKSLVVIENLVLAALEVGKLMYMPTGVKALSIGEVPKPKKLEEIHITIDPTNEAERKNANSILKGLDLNLREGLSIGGDSYRPINLSFDGDQKYSGLLFRPLMFYRLYQGGGNSEGGKLVASFAVPDPTQHYCVPLKRRVFVASKTKLEIEKGMLKGLHIEKGSEAEAISGLPLRLVKEVLSLPKGILIYQSNQIQAETTLIEAQTRQIKALQDLEKTRQGAQ